MRRIGKSQIRSTKSETNPNTGTIPERDLPGAVRPRSDFVLRISDLRPFRPCRDGRANDLEYLLALGTDQRQARWAAQFGAVAALGGGQLDVLHQLDVRVQVADRRVPPVDF